MSKNYCKLEKKWCNCCTNHGCTWICGKCAPILSAMNYKEMKTCPKRTYYRTVSVKELMNVISFEEMFRYLVKYFPDQKNNKEGYLKLWNILKNTKPERFDGWNKWYLVTRETHDDEAPDEIYLDTYLRHRGNVIGHWAGIEFMSYPNFLYLNVDPIYYNIGSELSQAAVLAGAIYELSFFGYDEEERNKNTKWKNKDFA